jgi:prolyl-tRNA synthetase
MRYSKLFGKTQREIPRNVGTISQQLLMRAGFLKSSGAGSLLLLPLARRVLQKANRIVAGEAAARGVQYVEAPPPLPGAVQERTPGAELKRALAGCRPLMRQQYFMAPQHEEDLCLLAGTLPMTYKELPLMIGIRRWHLREDVHGLGSPAFSRQFPAHAGYSFDAGEASAGNSYALLREACQFAIRQTGVEILAVHAWPASPGVPASEEFLALSASGSEKIVLCETCEYRARLDCAQSLFPEFRQQEGPRPLEAVYGPGIVNTSELAAFVGIPVEKTTKTLLFQADDSLVAACVRGEYDVSEAKLAALLGCSQLRLAPAAIVKEATGADVGYAGPLGLPAGIRILWDQTTACRVNFECGANRTGYHNINVNFDRDLPVPAEFFDLSESKEGEICAQCGLGRLSVRQGTRLGHVTRLGSMYATELKAAYTSSEGDSQPMLLTCCGMDMMRLLATIVELHNDKRGILWPRPVAPFLAHLISLPGVEDRAAEIHAGIERAGIEVLWDDRNTLAGAKFGDADLIGIPVRLVLSTRTGGKLEWKERGSELTEFISPEEAIRRLIDLHL